MLCCTDVEVKLRVSNLLSGISAFSGEVKTVCCCLGGVTICLLVNRFRSYPGEVMKQFLCCC